MYISAFLRAFAEWRKYRSAVREFSALDDRILGDIGLDRAMIREAVRTGVGR
jgi:uncharacterized protein YjiS (DUF1127 family)